MKSYQVEVKVRNNYLLNRMKDEEYNVVRLSKASGVSIRVIYEMINLKFVPIDGEGGIHKHVQSVCDVLSCTPWDIFPPEHFYEALDKNKVTIEASKEDLMGHNLLTHIEDNMHLLLDGEKLDDAVTATLDGLPARCRRVVEARFYEGKSYAEIGEELGCSMERVRQIEAKALRMLRHPTRSDTLKELACTLDIVEEGTVNQCEECGERSINVKKHYMRNGLRDLCDYCFKFERRQERERA